MTRCAKILYSTDARPLYPLYPIYTTINIMRGTEISFCFHIINLCVGSWVRETLLKLLSELRSDALPVTAIDFSVIRTDYSLGKNCVFYRRAPYPIQFNCFSTHSHEI